MLFIDKFFIPYATSNLIRNKLNITKLINFLLSGDKIDFDIIKRLVNIMGKRDYRYVIDYIITIFKPKSIKNYNTLVSFFSILFLLIDEYSSNNDFLQQIKLASQQSLFSIKLHLIRHNTNYDYDKIIRSLSDKDKDNIIEHLILINADIKILEHLLQLFAKRDYSSLISKLKKTNNVDMIKILDPYNNCRII